MENQHKNKTFKAPGNEGYDINRPQNLAKPAFHSASESKGTTGAPPVENLNQENDENNQLGANTVSISAYSETVNDEPLHGNDQKTNLGDGKEPEDKEEEKLIRK